jgi:hypothetical protein
LAVGGPWPWSMAMWSGRKNEEPERNNATNEETHVLVIKFALPWQCRQSSSVRVTDRWLRLCDAWMMMMMMMSR